jgi:alkaline phosphatase
VRPVLALLACVLVVPPYGAAIADARRATDAGSAVFLHVDGMGANTWAAMRLAEVGPAGRLAWDRLPHAAVYVGPMLDRATATSNGGATTHAWGVRAESGSYGMIGGRPIPRALSGATVPLGLEAQRAGKAVGIVNSASVTEPGSGAYLAVVQNRKDHAAIAAQILAAKPDVVLGGGERYFLPAGVRGRHGPGARPDGRNLVEEAQQAGYTVVFTREDLAAVPAGTRRLLGLFATEDTFNEGSEQQLAGASLPLVKPQAPRFDEMIAAALRILSASPSGFLIVANEEATDNLAGHNNAAAVMETGRGADRAIRIVTEAAARDPRITLVVASDSDCGGLQAQGGDLRPDETIPERSKNGAPVDGLDGKPFLSAPDRAGRRHPFIVSWAATGDLSGGLVARGIGPGAERYVRGTMDSSDVYRALYLGLFGKALP